MVMGLKNFIQRLFPRGYISLDKRGVSHLLTQIDSFKREGYAFSFSFLNIGGSGA